MATSTLIAYIKQKKNRPLMKQGSETNAYHVLFLH